jgi:hypothetical protein
MFRVYCPDSWRGIVGLVYDPGPRKNTILDPLCPVQSDSEDFFEHDLVDRRPRLKISRSGELTRPGPLFTE